MLASGTVGGAVDLYEPVHGSAPDIAGSNTANPLGAIASAGMLLRHTAKLEDEAAEVEAAIQGVLAGGYRTRDIADGILGQLVSTYRDGATRDRSDRRICRYAVCVSCCLVSCSQWSVVS